MTKRVILVVDDEPTVRSFIKNILRAEGFAVLEAADGVDALEQAKQSGSPVSLLITDIRMPRMDGIALGRAMAKTYRELPVLYISGYPFDIEEQRGYHLSNGCAFLSKPFRPQALIDTVYKCLGLARTVSAGGS